MSPSVLAIGLLALAVAIGLVRTLHRFWRLPATGRPRAWRMALLLVLPVLCAALLHRTLFPPPERATGHHTLVVATGTGGAHDDTTPSPSRSPGERWVALPEAGDVPGAERVPDLGTALRRHPDARALRIVGAGLTARDRDTASPVPATFDPAPLPRGLVELAAPARVAAGSRFEVHGRGEALRGGTAELVDPAGAVQERQALDAAGRFRLAGTTRTAGPVEFRLRLRDAVNRLVEETTVPVVVEDAAAARLLVLAGGTNAETKFLRRWALDAGLQQHARIALGGGLQIGDAPVAFTAEGLRRFDAVVVDPRSWNALGAARRRAVLDAVRDGLGVLFRMDGSADPQVRRTLRELGLRVEVSRVPATFVLEPKAGSRSSAIPKATAKGALSETTDIAGGESPGQPTEGLPSLGRTPLAISGDDSVVVLRDAAGTPMAGFAGWGRGRVGWWLPVDSFALVLSGRDDLHASLWSGAVGAVARPVSAAPVARLPAVVWKGERGAFCGVAGPARVIEPAGATLPLHVDPATPERCAGYWPVSAGWHSLRVGEAELPFHVRDPAKAPALHAADRRDATFRWLMATRGSTAPAGAATPTETPREGNRWPWFFAWLLVSGLLWWLERPRPNAAAASGEVAG